MNKTLGRWMIIGVVIAIVGMIMVLFGIEWGKWLVYPGGGMAFSALLLWARS